MTTTRESAVKNEIGMELRGMLRVSSSRVGSVASCCFALRFWIASLGRDGLTWFLEPRVGFFFFRVMERVRVLSRFF
jgi:hypothetical protein